MIKRILALVMMFNTGVIIAQNSDTTFIDRDTLTQEIMLCISHPFSKVDVHIAEIGPNELISVKDDYRYIKYMPRPWLYNFKLSLQSNLTDEDIKTLIRNVQMLASKETKVSENWWDRVGNSNPLICPWYELYDFMTKYKDWVIGESRIRCSHCFKKTMLIYYITPDYTWRRLYGRAGYFLICPYCLKQMDFCYMVLN